MDNKLSYEFMPDNIKNIIGQYCMIDKKEVMDRKNIVMSDVLFWTKPIRNFLDKEFRAPDEWANIRFNCYRIRLGSPMKLATCEFTPWVIKRICDSSETENGYAWMMKELGLN